MSTNTMTSFEQLRFMGDGAGSVYEYCAHRRAWIFIGKLNGETLEDWLADYRKGDDVEDTTPLDYDEHADNMEHGA